MDSEIKMIPLPNNAESALKLNYQPIWGFMEINEMPTPLTLNFEYKPPSRVEIIWSLDTKFPVKDESNK